MRSGASAPASTSAADTVNCSLPPSAPCSRSSAHDGARLRQHAGEVAAVGGVAAGHHDQRDREEDHGQRQRRARGRPRTRRGGATDAGGRGRRRARERTASAAPSPAREATRSASRRSRASSVAAVALAVAARLSAACAMQRAAAADAGGVASGAGQGDRWSVHETVLHDGRHSRIRPRRARSAIAPRRSARQPRGGTVPSSSITRAGSTGLTRWRSKPASTRAAGPSPGPSPSPPRASSTPSPLGAQRAARGRSR